MKRSPKFEHMAPWNPNALFKCHSNCSPVVSCSLRKHELRRGCQAARPRAHSLVHFLRQASFQAGTWCMFAHTAR